MDSIISERGPRNHLSPCHTQTRGQRNLEAKNRPPPRCFLVVTCTIWLRFPVSDSGGGVLTVLPPCVFPRGQNLPKSSPKRSTFRRSKLSKIVPKRSTVHSPKLFLLPCMPSRVVCPQRICMPSRDLYALKGLVCAQGICMPSRDLRDLGPMGRPHNMSPRGGRQGTGRMQTCPT